MPSEFDVRGKNILSGLGLDELGLIILALGVLIGGGLLAASDGRRVKGMMKRLGG